MNKTKARAVILKDSAATLLMEKPTTFQVQPWRTIMQENLIKAGRRATDPIIPVVQPNLENEDMTKAIADEKAKDRKDAVAKAKQKGITEYKHKPGESAPGVKGIFPDTSPRTGAKAGVDKTSGDVVHSGFPPTTTNKEANTMTEDIKSGATEAQAKKEADAKAKIAAKEAKIKAAADKKAEAEKAKEAKAAERAAAQADKKAEREAKQAQAAEARKAADPEGKRTYFGPMLNLADRVKSGAYKKGINGQLRSNDAVATALEVVHPKRIVELLLKVLHLDANPYENLNYGQQSMNLRNKLRGAIKADDGMGLILVPGTDTQPPVRVTIERLKTLRDEGGYATEEDAIAKKKEAAEAKKQAAAEAKAKKEADAKAAADKKAEAKKQAAPAQPAA